MEYLIINFLTTNSMDTLDFANNLAKLALNDNQQQQNDQKNQKTQQKTKKKTFTHGDNVMIINPTSTYKGYFGSVVEFIPAKNMIEINGTVIIIAKNSTEKEGNNFFKITKGDYKGNSGTMVGTIPAKLTVYLDAIGRSVNTHYVKENGENALRPISPNDVFYFDIELKDGRKVQVTKLEDDEIHGNLERTGEGIIFSQNDIATYLSGFKIGEKTFHEPISNIDDTIDTLTTIDETEDPDDIDNMFSDYAEEPVEREETREVSSFKDQERSSYDNVGLNKEETGFKKKIVDILNMFNIEESVVNIIAVIKKCMQAVEKMKVQYNKRVQTDDKYIVACFVFYEIIKLGYTNLVLNLESYLTKLVENKFLSNKDGQASLFATDITKKEKGLKMYIAVFKNCEMFLKSNFDISDRIEQNTSFDALIPIVRTKNVVKRFIAVKDLVQFRKNNGSWDQEAFENFRNENGSTRIMWGETYMPIMNFYKRALDKKIKNATNDATRTVYKYVMNFIEQAPFKFDATQMDVKLRTLKNVWEKFFNEYLVFEVQRIKDVSASKVNKNNQTTRRGTSLDQVTFNDITVVDDSSFTPESVDLPKKKTRKAQLEKEQRSDKELDEEYDHIFKKVKIDMENRTDLTTNK